jgi:hypothetical protein
VEDVVMGVFSVGVVMDDSVEWLREGVVLDVDVDESVVERRVRGWR